MFQRSILVGLVALIILSVSISVAIGNTVPVAGASNFGFEGQAQCPKVTIYSPDTVQAGGSLTFTANVSGGDKNVSPTYNWSISAGTISSGQGTSAITVDTNEAGGMTITATVELGGYDRTCSAVASSTTSVEKKAEAKKITDYGYSATASENERNMLDNFAIELQNDPTSKGYIIAYGSTTVTAVKVKAWTTRALNHLVKTRKMDAGRFTVVDGGNRKTAITELWLAPNGAPAPEAKPDAAATTPATKSATPKAAPKTSKPANKKSL